MDIYNYFQLNESKLIDEYPKECVNNMTTEDKRIWTRLLLGNLSFDALRDACAETVKDRDYAKWITTVRSLPCDEQEYHIRTHRAQVADYVRYEHMETITNEWCERYRSKYGMYPSLRVSMDISDLDDFVVSTKGVVCVTDQSGDARFNKGYILETPCTWFDFLTVANTFARDDHIYLESIDVARRVEDNVLVLCPWFGS